MFREYKVTVCAKRKPYKLQINTSDNWVKLILSARGLELVAF